MGRVGGTRPRTSAFYEMPYDDSLINAMKFEHQDMEPGVDTDAFALLMGVIVTDIGLGVGLQCVNIIPSILHEMENILSTNRERQPRLFEDLNVGAEIEGIARIGEQLRKLTQQVAFIQGELRGLGWLATSSELRKALTSMEEASDMVASIKLRLHEKLR